ncbi:MAG: LLM class F420-dependent oxidoreductase, partial [Actinomycetota bacterium]|nr:LLM class F420-dependent oxidoreductase [Actinomycetota bacterium]
AVFPQTEIGADPGAIRAYATGVQHLGFHHIAAYDHVLGADPAVHAGWSGVYDVDTEFHEPMVLFGYLAALTSLELVIAVLVLPQRQTALVAKQAAQVDLLTGGRFRLGIGVGWNEVEYRALGKDFRDRGRRSSAQVALLRSLWTERSVTFSSGDDQVIGAGLAPLPVQRPIPVWFGGQSAAAYERTGRLGDGWFPHVLPGPDLDAARAMIESAALDAGRDPSAIGMEGGVNWRGDLAKLVDHARNWEAAGASHLFINTMNAGLSSVDDHLDALALVADALGVQASPY